MQITIEVYDTSELRTMNRALEEIFTKRDDARRTIEQELRAELEAEDERDVRRGVARAAAALSESNLAPVDINNAMVEGECWDTDDVSDVFVQGIGLGEGAESAEEMAPTARKIVTAAADPITETPSERKIITAPAPTPAELNDAMRAAAGLAGLPAAVEVLKAFNVARVPDLPVEHRAAFLQALQALPRAAA